MSIGFYCDDLVCDLCGRSIHSSECPHVPGQEYQDQYTDHEPKVCTATYDGKAEMVEGSIVYLGCQQEAELVKAAQSRDWERLAQIKSSPEVEDAADAPTDRGAADKKLPTAQLEQAVREKEARIAQLQPQAAEGQELRSDLLAEIRRLARLCGLGEEGQLMVERLKDAELGELKRLRASYEARWNQVCPPRPVAELGSVAESSQSPEDRAYSL